MKYILKYIIFEISVDRTVPEAIHNPVAIKPLESGLLTLHICVMYACSSTSWQVLHSYIFCIHIYVLYFISPDRRGKALINEQN